MLVNGRTLKTVAGVLATICLRCVVAEAQDDAGAAEAGVPPILKIGSQAPNFNLPGTDGKMHRLKDFASNRVLVIVFTCNHCPIAQMYERRIEQLESEYRDRGVGLVAINPNDAKAEQIWELEYSDLGDTLADMKIRAQYRHFNFPYLYDGETQAVSTKYGPTATPHVFVFDQARKLRYEGRVDNNPSGLHVTKHEAQDAIEALVDGKDVPVEHTPTVGCSTKWASKEASARAEKAQLDQTPLDLQMISPDQLKNLRMNRNTGKFLLVDFWATWCGPCTEEFPALEEAVRMYRKRPLDIVTVSMNSPEEKKFVVSFLEKQHPINKNFLIGVQDSADAVSAFGTEWTGGVPYFVLIGPDGEVLFKSQGGISDLDLRRAILKNLPDDHYIGQHAYWNSTF